MGMGMDKKPIFDFLFFRAQPFKMIFTDAIKIYARKF